MKTLLISALVWLPLASGFAADPLHDFDPVLMGSWPGYRRGPASSVAVSDGHVYLSAGSLHVFKLGNPAQPQRVGHYGEAGPYQRIFAVAGDLACVANYLGADLHVVDVSNPAKPERLGVYAVHGRLLKVAMSGKYSLALIQWFDPEVNRDRWALEILDLHNPTKPARTSRWDAGLGEPLWTLAVSGSHVYLGGEGLHVIDIATPTSPRRIGRYNSNTVGGVYSIVISGMRAYLGGLYPTLDVVDITDPTRPLRVGQFDWTVNGTSWSVPDLAVFGHNVYLAHITDVKVFDVSDPARPRRVGTYETPQATGIAIAGHYAYVSDQQEGMLVLDLADPVSPRKVDVIETGGFTEGLAFAGKYAYLAEGYAGLQVVDLADPAQPRWLARLDTGGYAQDVALSGSLAVVADGFAGLQVADISIPGEPHWLGGTGETGTYYNRVAVTGRYACVAARQHGLVVVDLSDPGRPRPVGRSATTGIGLGVAAAGHYAYLAAGCTGLEIIDIADPVTPRRVATFPACATQVAVVDSFAYVGTSGFGLLVLDVSKPAEPRRMGELDLSTLSGGDVWGIAASEGFVHLVGQTGGDESQLVTVDVANPTQPHLYALTRLPPAGGARDVAVAHGLALVANGWEGYEALGISIPSNPQRWSRQATRGPAIDLAISSHHAFVASGSRWSNEGELLSLGALEAFDLSDPSSPKHVGTFDLAPSQDHGAIICGDAAAGLACLITERTEYAPARLLVLDVTDPSRPQLVGSYALRYEVTGLEVAVSGRWAWVVLGPEFQEPVPGNMWRGGLFLLDLGNPTDPQPVLEYEVPGAATITINSDRAYVAAEGVVHILDISNPPQPRPVGALVTDGVATEVAVAGGLAYVAEGVAGLLIVDVADPARARPVGRFVSRLHPASVIVLGPYAYVTDAQSGLHVLDIANPAQPRRAGGNPAPRGRNLALYENHVVVADGTGLTILNAFVPLQVGPASLEAGILRLSVHGPPNLPVRIQRSHDLTTWQDWQSLTLGNERIELIDSAASSQPRGFYRAMPR